MDAEKQLLESQVSEIKENNEEKEDVWKYLVGVVPNKETTDIDFFLEIEPEKLKDISKESLLLDIIENENEKYENTPVLRNMSKDLFMIKIRTKAQDNIIPCLYESPTKLSREEIKNYLNSVDIETIRKAEIKL